MIWLRSCRECLALLSWFSPCEGSTEARGALDGEPGGGQSRLRRENPAIDIISERNRLDRRALRMGAGGRRRSLQREKGLGNCFQGLAKARNSADVLEDQMLASATQELNGRPVCLVGFATGHLIIQETDYLCFTHARCLNRDGTINSAAA